VQDALLLLVLERGGRVAPAVRQGVGLVDAAPGEDVLDPAAAAEVPDLSAGDAVEPSRQVPTVEGGEAPADDQEDLLHDVVAIGVEAAERPNPARDIFEPVVVEGTEIVDDTQTSMEGGGAPFLRRHDRRGNPLCHVPLRAR